MKRILLLTLFSLLLTARVHADCLELPIIGNGMEPKGKAESAWTNSEGSYRPDIPAALIKLYPKLAFTYTTIGFPRITKGKPEFSTVATCFLDSIKLPPGLGPMTLDQAAMFAHNRDARVPFNPDGGKLPAPKTSFERFFSRAWRTASRYLGPALAWATTSTDNFNRGSGSDLGAAWDPYNDGASTDCSLDVDRVSGTTDGARCVEGYNTFIPGANQYVQFIVHEDGSWPAATGGNVDLSAYVRLAAPTTLTGYACRLGPSDAINRTRIRRYDGGGSNSALANDTTTVWVDGDIARCEITGSTITAKQNGVTVLTNSGDTTYASGRGGIGSLSTPSTANQNWIDDFEVGDIGGGATVVRHRPLLIQ